MPCSPYTLLWPPSLRCVCLVWCGNRMLRSSQGSTQAVSRPLAMVRRSLQSRAISSKIIQLSELTRANNEPIMEEDMPEAADNDEMACEGLPVVLSPPAPLPDTCADIPDSFPQASVSFATVTDVLTNHPADIGRISPAAPSPALFSDTYTSPSSSLRGRTSPLDELEDAVSNWSASHGE